MGEVRHCKSDSEINDIVIDELAAAGATGFGLSPGSPGLTLSGKITTLAVNSLQKCSRGRFKLTQ